LLLAARRSQRDLDLLAEQVHVRHHRVKGEGAAGPHVALDVVALVAGGDHQEAAGGDAPLGAVLHLTLGEAKADLSPILLHLAGAMIVHLHDDVRVLWEEEAGVLGEIARHLSRRPTQEARLRNEAYTHGHGIARSAIVTRLGMLRVGWGGLLFFLVLLL